MEDLELQALLEEMDMVMEVDVLYRGIVLAVAKDKRGESFRVMAILLEANHLKFWMSFWVGDNIIFINTILWKDYTIFNGNTKPIWREWMSKHLLLFMVACVAMVE
jgi:hypothetical protein